MDLSRSIHPQNVHRQFHVQQDTSVQVTTLAARLIPRVNYFIDNSFPSSLYLWYWFSAGSCPDKTIPLSFPDVCLTDSDCPTGFTCTDNHVCCETSKMLMLFRLLK